LIKPKSNNSLDNIHSITINSTIKTITTEKQEYLLTALTKTTIIDKISTQNNQTPSQAKRTIETLLEIIKSTLASGEDLMISGFGKFQVNEKAPRKGRNPATGERMVLNGRRVVTFKVAGKLRDRVNDL